MSASSKKGPELERYRGDSKAHVFTVTDSDGVAVDITSWTFKMTVDTLFDPPAGGATVLFTVVGSITNAAGGEFEIAPTAVQTDQAPDSYFYDVEAVDAASRIDTLAKNKYTIFQDISK